LHFDVVDVINRNVTKFDSLILHIVLILYEFIYSLLHSIYSLQAAQRESFGLTRPCNGFGVLWKDYNNNGSSGKISNVVSINISTIFIFETSNIFCLFNGLNKEMENQ